MNKLETIGENHDHQLKQVKERIAMEHKKIENKKAVIKSLYDTSKRNACPDFSTLQAKQNKARSSLREYQKICHPGYVIAFDNIDIHVKRRDMTLKAQNTDIHWVNHTMIENRVSGNCLSVDAKEPADIHHVSNINFFPSIEDHEQQRLSYIILVSRILVDYIDALSVFKDVCICHIPHKYSKAMSTKSTKVI